MTAQVAADLRAAANVLERDGWTQHKYHEYRDGQLCHCAYGAIAVATGEHLNIRPLAESITGYDRDYGGAGALDRSESAADAVGQFITYALEDWNDAHGRTAAEVIAALRAAAEKADQS